jgi:hypothetical protein
MILNIRRFFKDLGVNADALASSSEWLTKSCLIDTMPKEGEYYAAFGKIYVTFRG